MHAHVTVLHGVITRAAAKGTQCRLAPEAPQTSASPFKMKSATVDLQCGSTTLISDNFGAQYFRYEGKRPG